MFGKAANVKGKSENLSWIHRGPLVDKKTTTTTTFHEHPRHNP